MTKLFSLKNICALAVSVAAGLLIFDDPFIGVIAGVAIGVSLSIVLGKSSPK